MTVPCSDGDCFIQEVNRAAVLGVDDNDHYLSEQACPQCALDILRTERRRCQRDAWRPARTLPASHRESKPLYATLNALHSCLAR